MARQVPEEGGSQTTHLWFFQRFFHPSHFLGCSHVTDNLKLVREHPEIVREKLLKEVGPHGWYIFSPSAEQFEGVSFGPGPEKRAGNILVNTSPLIS